MQQQPASGPVFVDAISGQHVSTDPQSLLQQRRLTFSKDYGWQYDVWVDNPGKYALSGANSRFSLPAITQRVHQLVSDAGAFACRQVSERLQQKQQAQAPGRAPEGLQQQRQQEHDSQ